MSVNVKRIISISFNIILIVSLSVRRITNYIRYSSDTQAIYIIGLVDNLILKGADYMESFEPGVSFIPVSRAEISARPKDKSY
jgi:hypothetical protein